MKKGASPFRIFFNPGLIFLLSILAVGVLIVVHNKDNSALDFELSEKKTMGSLTHVEYPEEDNASTRLMHSKSKGGDNNKSRIKFKDITLESGIDFYHAQGGIMLNAISEVIGSGACTADVDNDGFLDIYAVNGSGYTHFYGKKWWWYKTPYNTLYHNNGDRTFTNVTEKTGVGDSGWGMGCAFGDYDNDGDIDIFLLNNNDYANLLQNETSNSNNWLNIRLSRGRRGNRDPSTGSG